MSHSLCNRCDQASACCLNYDGKPCRKLRSVEPTNYDRIMDMDVERLSYFIVTQSCPDGKQFLSHECFISSKNSLSVNDCAKCWLEYLNEEAKEDLA